MYSRLQNHLEKILISYNISNETSIFNDVLLKLAGIEINTSDAFGIAPSNEANVLLFYLPPISFDDVIKLLDFMKISKYDYIVGKPLIITEELLDERLLPKFETYIHNAMETASFDLNSYIIQSKPIIEEKAVKRIENAIKNFLIEIYHSSADGLSFPKLELTAYLQYLLFLIQSSDLQLHIQIIKYEKILLTFFTNHPEFEQNILYVNHIYLLKEGFANYSKFYQIASLLAVNNFFKELFEFTTSYNINNNMCNIFEDFIMNMATINSKPKLSLIKSGKDFGVDPTRIIFYIEGIHSEDAEIFIKFFHFIGDQSAKEYKIPKDRIPRFIKRDSLTNSLTEKNNKALDGRFFEVDGLRLYEVVLPRFKEEIRNCAEKFPEQLKKYKDICALKNILEKIDLLEDGLHSPTLIKKIKNHSSILLQKSWLKQIFHKLSITRSTIKSYYQTDFNIFVTRLVDIIQTLNLYKGNSIVKNDAKLTKLFSDLISSCYACKKQVINIPVINLDDKMDLDTKHRFSLSASLDKRGPTLFSSLPLSNSTKDNKTSTIQMFKSNRSH